jgi:hypothetical protein
MLAAQAEIKSCRYIDTKRYIRFICGKNTGRNLSLDDAAPYPKPPAPATIRVASFTCNEDE